MANDGFDLEAEIRDLAARRDIEDAVRRYMRGLDRLDPEMERSAFHDDAWVDAGYIKGSADHFVTESQAFLSEMAGSHHMLGQVRIELDGDRASGECYFQAWHAAGVDGERDLFVSGRYIDEYACQNGEWRISKRKLIVDWVADNAADHGFYAANPETNRGARRGEDFSDLRDWPD